MAGRQAPLRKGAWQAFFDSCSTGTKPRNGMGVEAGLLPAATDFGGLPGLKAWWIRRRRVLREAGDPTTRQ
jgi:hypothetical protein